MALSEKMFSCDPQVVKAAAATMTAVPKVIMMIEIRSERYLGGGG